MRKNFRYINIFIVTLAVLAGVVFFAILKINTPAPSPGQPETKEKSVELYHPQSVEHEEAPKTVIPTDYTIKLKDGILYFYLNSEKERILLESTPINISLYPTDDIKALSESITVKTLEEGISIIEDFTS